MPLIAYTHKKPGAERMALIDKANEIITEYAQGGYSLTLRQLYYQFVSRDLLPNSQKSYKRLGDVISDGRMAGLIDWDAISDRLREMRGSRGGWQEPSEIVRACARAYSIDLWAGQVYRPEVWVEKDALAEVVENAASELRCPVMVCRGYMSQSAMWEAGHERFRKLLQVGLRPVVIHLGDHDPSGLDMTRDIAARLSVFADGDVEVRRIALNMEQVRAYEPPPNPAKITDSRADAYIAEHGDESWELDALEPRVLHKLIQGAIRDYINPMQWKAREAVQTKHRAELQGIADNYQRAVAWLKARKPRK